MSWRAIHFPLTKRVAYAEWTDIMNDWLEIIKNVTGIGNNVTSIIRTLVDAKTDDDSKTELRKYRLRVKTRRKTGEYRPEWDLLGRVVFDYNGNQTITEMDQVPESLQNTMTLSLQAGAIQPGPLHTVVVSDDNYRYLLEAGKDWRNSSATCVFWYRPAKS